MAKIGILTLPLGDNYGGVLQAVALYSHLVKMGHDVTLLHKQRNTQPLPPLTRFGRFLLENVPGQNRKGYRHRNLRRRSHAGFLRRHVSKQSRPLATAAEVGEYASANGLDAIVAGSDQIWRMAYIDKINYTAFFLDFPKPRGFRKVAYAASFGVERWEAPTIAFDVARMLADFDAVSVRESSGLEICRNLFGRGDVTLALDPTLLVDPLLYRPFVRRPAGVEDGAFLTYILDRSLISLRAVKKLTDHVGKGKPVYQAIDGHRPYTMEEWLGLFWSAGFIATDSFHGMVFSIIFQKPFIVFSNPSRGATRTDSLARLLGVSHRVLRPGDNVMSAIEQPIDYAEVARRLQPLREASHSFLEKTLPGSCNNG